MDVGIQLTILGSIATELLEEVDIEAKATFQNDGTTLTESFSLDSGEPELNGFIEKFFPTLRETQDVGPVVAGLLGLEVPEGTPVTVDVDARFFFTSTPVAPSPPATPVAA